MHNPNILSHCVYDADPNPQTFAVSRIRIQVEKYQPNLKNKNVAVKNKNVAVKNKNVAVKNKNVAVKTGIFKKL